MAWCQSLSPLLSSSAIRRSRSGHCHTGSLKCELATDNSKGKKVFVVNSFGTFFLLMFSLPVFETKMAGLMQKSKLSSW